MKNKRTTINPKNNDVKCLKYAITVALNHQKVLTNQQRISNIETHPDQYDWNGIEFLLHKKGWNNFEKNNETIALNVLFDPCNTKQIRTAYVSKYIFL